MNLNTDDQTENPLPENGDSEQQPAPMTEILGYDMKAKTKNVPVLEAVIKKTAKNGYMVSGVSAAGNKMTTLVNKEKAMAAIEAGIAQKGWED